MQEMNITIFTEAVADTAIKINANLKHRRKQIALGNLFIAATAVTQNLAIATLNKKHLERIEVLTIVE